MKLRSCFLLKTTATLLFILINMQNNSLAHDTSNDLKSNWTGKDGVNNLEDFKDNQEAQIKAIKEYHKLIWTYLKSYHRFEGQEIAGVKITKSGMIAAAHLVGHMNLKRFLKSKGTYVAIDGNDKPCTIYLRDFAGYKLEF